MAAQKKSRGGGSTARTILAKHGFQDVDKGNSDHDLACQFLGLPEQMLAIAKLIYREPRAENVDLRCNDAPEWRSPRLEALLAELPPGLRVHAGWKGIMTPKSGPGLQWSLRHDDWWTDIENGSLADGVHKLGHDSASGPAMKAKREIERMWRAGKNEILAAIARFEAAGDWTYSHLRGPSVTRSIAGSLVEARDPRFEVPINKGAAAYKTTVGFADLMFDMDVHWRVERRVKTPDEEDAVSFERRFAAHETALVEVKATPVSGAEILRQINLYLEYLPDWTFAAVATPFDLTADDASMLRSQNIVPIRLGAKFQAWKATRGGKATDVEEL